MSALRGGSILTGFMALTMLLRIAPRLARRMPHWYHRQVCRLIGVRLHVEGQVARDTPVLLVANHTSWLDIPVLSAVAPLSFVAKKEVGTWPFVASLARLQRTVFVDRERRLDVGETTSEIAGRLADGEAVVLFAEGTSSDGNRVLPFKTSLFAAAKPTSRGGAEAEPGAVVQTVSLVYTALHGLPLGRHGRPHVGWYGDMEMQSHAWALLKSGPLDVHIRIGDPVPLASFADRKALARHSEDEVRAAVTGLLRGPRLRRNPMPTRPLAAAHPMRRTKTARTDAKWT